MGRRRIFLLSPAYAGGIRARMAMRDEATFDLAARLRGGDASLAEVFTFLSGLYFRGKVEYARAFSAPPDGVEGALVITAGLGLLPLDRPLTLAGLRDLALIPVDAGEPRFREPFERDARALNTAIGPECDVVLLGSVASAKYVEPLLGIFGARLLVPQDFVGRGDMSRGGLMLRCARDGSELAYIPVAGATTKGKRPPKLPKLR